MDDKDVLISELQDITEILFDNGYCGWGNAIRKAINIIRKERKIIPCKDCKYLINHPGFMDDGYCAKIKMKPKPDFFCAYGKRR